MQLLAFILGYLALLARADTTLSEFQPIAQFSDSCTDAYNTPIKNCDNARFAPFGAYASCSKSCLNELNGLVTTIQQACQHDGVKPNTIIAHAFQGDLANWMCGAGPYTTSSATVASGTATNAYAGKTSSSAASTGSSAATSSSGSSSSSISSSLSSESSTVSTASSTSTTLSTSSASSASAVASSTRTPPRPTSTFDSTPFDQTAGTNAASDGRKRISKLLVVEVVIPIVSGLICLTVGGWIY